MNICSLFHYFCVCSIYSCFFFLSNKHKQQEADERNLEWHSNNNIPDGRTFATCFGHEDISTEEMDQFENLLEEIHL